MTLKQLVALFIIFLTALSFKAQGQSIIFLKTDSGFWFTEDREKILFFNRNNNKITGSKPFISAPSIDDNSKSTSFTLNWTWKNLSLYNSAFTPEHLNQNLYYTIKDIHFSLTNRKSGLLIYTLHLLNAKTNETLLQEKYTIEVYPKRKKNRQINIQLELRSLEKNLHLELKQDDVGYGLLLNKQSSLYMQKKTNNFDYIALQFYDTKSGLIINRNNSPFGFSWYYNPEKQLVSEKNQKKRVLEIPVKDPISFSYNLFLLEKTNNRTVRRILKEKTFKKNQTKN